MIRYALSKTSNDRYPIHFKNDSEITSIGHETLVEVIERLERHGYELIHSREELIKKLEARGLTSKNGWQEVLD